ncbi:hypothetical protein [Methylocystis parvus]|uniref:Uncharacterized protein n=1 Tax=Methylocystis parvus TaxID=134 RepID=A0A6B8M5C4_9HYPH|nr:hypothetical protein [Methylocystis parvus]QGM97535.1 hypothetical protein F7D14_08720 [Methylocystis parvus]WBJ98539.1 hypothetical protein MMG94_10885 [Methylocystis parvus OBBP]
MPEYRQIELYTKRKALAFLPTPATDDVPFDRIAAVAHAALLFEATLAEIVPSDLPLTSWARCKELPKRTRIEKILAELHRILRIVRKVSFHSHGHADMRDGIICLNGAIDMVALSLEITASGLDLLETMTAYWLVNRDGVFPDAYIEMTLGEYFCDLVAEIKRFSDEDRILYQFRRSPAFNRHFRFDCDNPKVAASDGKLIFEIGERYRDAARYSIDFYLVWDDALHIIPVEVLKNGELHCEELPKWRARTPDAFSLPAEFRTRFAREKIVVGQPMT